MYFPIRGLVEGVLQHPNNVGGIVFDEFKSFNRIFNFDDFAIFFFD